MVDETNLIRTIIIGSDWQEVLETIVLEECMDPLSIDIIKLADAFTDYLEKLKTFDFRIPARFVLITAILLRMKCELLLEEEEIKAKEEVKRGPKINVENLPELSAPIERRPIRKVTLDELVRALNKTFEFTERKEGKKLRMRRAIENLIEPEEDIEARIKKILEKIIEKNGIKFSELVPVWRRLDIVKTLMPVLYLLQRGKVCCEQEELFKEITIKIK